MNSSPTHLFQYDPIIIFYVRCLATYLLICHTCSIGFIVEGAKEVKAKPGKHQFPRSRGSQSGTERPSTQAHFLCAVVISACTFYQNPAFNCIYLRNPIIYATLFSRVNLNFY